MSEELELSLAVTIDDVHEGMLDDIRESLDDADTDTIELIQDSISGAVTPMVEETIYKAYQRTK